MRTKHRSHIRYAAPAAPVRNPRRRAVRTIPALPVRLEALRTDGRVVGGLVVGAIVSLGLWAGLAAAITHVA